MALGINSGFTIGTGRDVFTVMGPNTSAAGVVIAGEWRATPNNAKSAPAQLIVREAENGLVVFQFTAPGALPAGAPPVGARVRVILRPFLWTLGLTTQKPTLEGPEGILLFYVTAAGLLTAIVGLDDGAQFACDPAEMSLLELP
jgi:hypothetical protein